MQLSAPQAGLETCPGLWPPLGSPLQNMPTVSLSPAARASSSCAGSLACRRASPVRHKLAVIAQRSLLTRQGGCTCSGCLAVDVLLVHDVEAASPLGCCALRLSRR